MAAAKTGEKPELRLLNLYASSCGAAGGMHETLRKGIEKQIESERLRTTEAQDPANFDVSVSIERISPEAVRARPSSDELQNISQTDAARFSGTFVGKRPDLRLILPNGDADANADTDADAGADAGADAERFPDRLGALKEKSMGILDPPISKKSALALPSRAREHSKSVNKRPRKNELDADYVNDLVSCFCRLKPSDTSVAELSGMPSTPRKEAKSASSMIKYASGGKEKNGKKPCCSAQLEQVISAIESLTASPAESSGPQRAHEAKAPEETDDIESSEAQLASLMKKCQIKEHVSAFMPYIL